MLEEEIAGFADDAFGNFLEESVRLAQHIRFGDACHLPGLPLSLAGPGELASKAGDTLGALGRHDLHREAALAVFLHASPAPIAEIGHDPGKIGQLSLAPRIEALAVLPQEDVVDALGLRQR